MTNPPTTDPARAAAPPREATTARRGPVPHWAARGADRMTVLVVVGVAVLFILPLRALLRYQGPPMEEGFMLVFPEQVLNGQVPHRDFLHLYGPGSLWALAAWYKLLGVTLTAERIFGAAQLAAIVAGVTALARPWGHRVMAAVGILGVLLTVTPIGLTALAWDGAVALAVASIWTGLRARRWLTDASGVGEAEAIGRADRWLLLAGLLAGLALLFRPDVVVAITIASLAVGAGLTWPRRRRWLIGAVVGVAPYLVLVAMAGLGNTVQGLFLEPVFDLRGGRSLPVPPSWDRLDGALAGVAALRPQAWPLPALSSPHQVFVWFFLLPAAVLFVAGVGWWRVRAEPDAWRPRVLLAVGLLGLGLMPQALQRPDTTHLAWVSCVPLAFLPVAVAEALRHVSLAPLRRWAPTVAAVSTLLVPLFVIPHFTSRTYVDLVQQGIDDEVFGFPVSNAGRRFYLGSSDIAPVAQRMLDDLDGEVRAGQRLFVGTADLRKTPYSDAYLYYLLPDLVPATRYIEMDPGVANAPDSGLADEVASSDWLILSHVWDAWSEPNDSRDFGPDAPNEAVRDGFCAVGDYQPYFEVYRRCEAK